MSRPIRPDGEVFLHVQLRAAERYGYFLTREAWDRWNVALRTAVAGEPPTGEGDLSVREIFFDDKVFMALCSARRVLTLLVRRHALRLFNRNHQEL